MQPPFDGDAEASALGACLLSQTAVDECSEIISPEAFYLLGNAEIYRAILEVADSGKPVDTLTVAGHLHAKGNLADIGGRERIQELSAIGFSAPNHIHWAKIVHTLWVKRELINVGHEISTLGFEGQGKLEDIVAVAEERWTSLGDRIEGKRGTVFTAQELVQEFRDRQAKPEETGAGIPTPFTLLDPLKPKRLYVLGGYQGDGKSVCAIQFLRSACEAGKRVGFMSIEMGHEDLVDRLVATFGVPHDRILDGDLENYRDVVEMALNEIDTWDFSIDDDEDLEPASIRRAQRRGKYDLLIVDHLHRMRVDRKHIRESTSENVRAMVNIAKKFEIPVLLLAQLSRGQKHDPFPRPTMADFRETSAIESEAAMALFVWRLRDKDNVRQPEAELIVAKNRFGREGYQNLRFSSRHVKFEPIH